MSLEAATTLSQLNAANPAGTDKLASGDDHIRMIKRVLLSTFPNLTGPMLLTQDQLASILPALVPFGIITDWYGAADKVPIGWAICNGQIVTKTDGTGNVTTPDLQDRVIAGASATNLTGSARGQTLRTVTSEAGGGHSHVGTLATAGAHAHGDKTGGSALSIAQLPAHNHKNGIADNNANELFVYGSTASGVGGLYGTDAAQKHPGIYQGFTETVGGGATHDHAISSDGAHTHVATVDAVPAHVHSVKDIDVTQPTYALHKIMKI